MRTHGDPYETLLISPDVNNPFVGSSSDTQAIHLSQKSFIVAGDRRDLFFVGDQIELFVYIDDYSATANHTILVDAVIPYVVSNPLSNSLIVSGDVSGILNDETYYVYAGWVEGEKPYKVVSKTLISSSPDTYRLLIDTSTLVSEDSRNKHFGLKRTRIDLSSTTNIFTIDDVKFNVGTRDSWPGFSDPTTYRLGNIPHTIITVSESIVPQPPFSGITFDVDVPGYYFSGHITLPVYDVEDIITDTGVVHGFVIGGDLTAKLNRGKQFEIRDGSCDGIYTVYYSTYDNSLDLTHIYTAEHIDTLPSLPYGTVHYRKYGMNQSSPFRNDIPHNNVECIMSETFEIVLDPPYTWIPPTPTSTCPAPDEEIYMPPP